MIACPQCHQGAAIFVRETYEYPMLDSETGEADNDDTGEPWHEVWCNNCDRSLADRLTVEYTDKGFVITEMPL